ncbi:MAG: zinc ribbon domain-containing protein [Acidimicrobiales bacterium]
MKKTALPPGWHNEARLVAMRPERAQQQAMHRDVLGANIARNWVVERYRVDQEVRRRAAFVLGLVRLVHGPLPLEREAHKAISLVSLLGWWGGRVPSKADGDKLVRRALAVEIDNLAYGEEACAAAYACTILRIFAGHGRWKVSPGFPQSFEDLRWLWNRKKPEVLPWWSECSKEALASGIEMGASAIKNHRESLRGALMGERVGMPRFTSIHDGRGYAITTGAFGLLEGRHVQIPKVPGPVALAEDCTALFSNVKAGSARLLRLTVRECPDGTYECALGLSVKDEPVEPRPYVPRGIDLGCKTALMPSRGKPLDLARSPRRTHPSSLFANASGVAKVLSVTPRTTMVRRLIERCGNRCSDDGTHSKVKGTLATDALLEAKAWCENHDFEHPYAALKALLGNEDALEHLSSIDVATRGGAARAKAAGRKRGQGRVRRRDIEREEIHHLGHSPTRKARLAAKHAKERARHQRRASSRRGGSSYARGPGLARQASIDRLTRRIGRQSQSLARKREHAKKQRELVDERPGSVDVLAVLKVVFATLHGITLRGDTPRSGRYLVAKHQLASEHAKVSRMRKDGIHKATTREARRSSVVVVEGFNAKHLMAKGGRRKRGLDRSLAHRSFGEVRRQPGYKLPRLGGACLMAPAWYPSTKRCSRCGCVLDAILLSERVFRCPRCHLDLDRDRNAAKNLEQAAPVLLLLGALMALGLIDRKVLHKQFYETSGRVAPRTKTGRGGRSSVAVAHLPAAQPPRDPPTSEHGARRTERGTASTAPVLHREVA